MSHCSNFHGPALQDCIWIPIHFIKLYPENPAVPELKTGLRLFANHIKKLSEISPWGQAHDISTKQVTEAKRFPGSKRPVGYWAALAYNLAELGLLLKDKSLILLAEQQLQWLLGKNFADLSMVHGTSSRTVAGGDHMYWQTEFFSNWLKSDKRQLYFDGNVPTAAMRNIGKGTVKLKKGDNWQSYLEGYPQGYCLLPVNTIYGFHPAPSENYLPMTAQFTTAAAAVYGAMEKIKNLK
jgi:hypothetical protein